MTKKTKTPADRDLKSILGALKRRSKWITENGQAHAIRTMALCLINIYPDHREDILAMLSEKPKPKEKGGGVRLLRIKPTPSVEQIVTGCDGCNKEQREWYNKNAKPTGTNPRTIKAKPLAPSKNGTQAETTHQDVLDHYGGDKDQMLVALFSFGEYTEAERLEIEQETPAEISARLYELLNAAVGEFPEPAV